MHSKVILCIDACVVQDVMFFVDFKRDAGGGLSKRDSPPEEG